MSKIAKKKSALHYLILAHCKKQAKKMDTFAQECGVNRQRLYRISYGEAKLPDDVAEKLAVLLGLSVSKVTSLMSNHFESFKIKHRDDKTKPTKAVAGKICWNPKLEQWEHQIMMYNDLLEAPNYDHPVWGALSKMKIPNYRGSVAWETGPYLLFTIEE